MYIKSLIPSLALFLASLISLSGCSGCGRNNATVEEDTTIEEEPVVEEEKPVVVYVDQPEALLVIRKQIDSLYNTEPVVQMDINYNFDQIFITEKAYTEQLLQEIYKQSSQGTIRALKAEQTAYLAYHDALINAFRKLNERLDGFDGSAWPMSILAFAIEDTKMRQESLFGLINDTLNVATEIITRSHIQSEYSRFMGNLHEEAEYYSVKEQKKALQSDQKAWEKWMSTRATVSSTLGGEQKQIYDRMTNYIMKGKLLAINNEYQGYVLCPFYIWELRLDYSNTLDEITATCFTDRLREYIGKG